MSCLQAHLALAKAIRNSTAGPQQPNRKPEAAAQSAEELSVPIILVVEGFHDYKPRRLTRNASGEEECLQDSCSGNSEGKLKVSFDKACGWAAVTSSES